MAVYPRRTVGHQLQRAAAWRLYAGGASGGRTGRGEGRCDGVRRYHSAAMVSLGLGKDCLPYYINMLSGMGDEVLDDAPPSA